MARAGIEDAITELEMVYADRIDTLEQALARTMRYVEIHTPNGCANPWWASGTEPDAVEIAAEAARVLRAPMD